MNLKVNQKDISLYRVTHIKNIPHILEFGITHRNSPKANSNFISIGDISLINNRNTRNVIVDNGNDSNALSKQIVLGEFIPFYFGIKMPMLYVIQTGGNFVEKACSPEEIIYMKCILSEVISSCNNFYFSDGHATDFLTTFYDSRKLNELPLILDWTAIKSSYWGGEENLDLKRKKTSRIFIRTRYKSKFDKRIWML